MNKLIGLYGGLFDPIHLGHLRPIYELLDQLPLHHVRFIPCASPPHKAAPLFSIHQRIQLLKAAILGEKKFIIDSREQQRQGPSYTIDTLRSIHHENPKNSLCLIIGSDAFNQITSWFEWQQLLDYSHIIITLRPQQQLSTQGEVKNLLNQYLEKDTKQLTKSTHGHIITQQVTQLDISSTYLRQLILQKKSTRYLVPDNVHEMIQQLTYNKKTH
jgi:nicotinate-nucleotide adenylyltransferase